jgi:hypothetical protein
MMAGCVSNARVEQRQCDFDHEAGCRPGQDRSADGGVQCRNADDRQSPRLRVRWCRRGKTLTSGWCRHDRAERLQGPDRLGGPGRTTPARLAAPVPESRMAAENPERFAVQPCGLVSLFASWGKQRRGGRVARDRARACRQCGPRTPSRRPSPCYRSISRRLR